MQPVQMRASSRKLWLNLEKKIFRGDFQYVGNIISIFKYLRISHVKERLILLV